MATAVRRIGIPEADDRYSSAASIGQEAAIRVVTARAGDDIDISVNYIWGPEEPGVYQRTPGGLTAPDTPQARYLRTFGGLGDITRFCAPPPPSTESPEYEDFLLDVKARGEENSTIQSAFDTETAYFWRENSVIQWNRFAINVLGERWATDVPTSARFALQPNYAIANAAIAGWNSKSFYNSWRPVTAIRRDDIWLPSGNNVTDPTWTPLLDPTPNHQEYTSTHACFGAAAGTVIKIWNGGDDIGILQSTNATAAGAGELTRPYTSIRQAVKENEDSRIFGGIHFQFASDVGSEIGDAVGKATVDAAKEGWADF